MEYRKIPFVEKEASRIVFGTATAPMMAGEESGEFFDALYEMGINTFDTARQYNLAEKVLGDWMASRNMRDKVNIITKGAHHLPDGTKRVSRIGIEEDLKRSQELLQTDHFEMYLLHRDDETVPVGEIVEILNELHERGAIGAFGGSNWTRERVEEANAYAAAHGLVPFTISSPNYGLAEQRGDVWGGGSTTISGPAHEKDREWYAGQHMPIIAYSSLARGMFAGRIRSTQRDQAEKLLDEFAVKGYCCEDNFQRLARTEELCEEKGCTVAQLALAYILCQKELDVFAVCSSTSPERIRDNIRALSVKLTEEELEWLDLRRQERRRG